MPHALLKTVQGITEVQFAVFQPPHGRFKLRQRLFKARPLVFCSGRRRRIIVHDHPSCAILESAAFALSLRDESICGAWLSVSSIVFCTRHSTAPRASRVTIG